jgi:hypothetical protein
LGVDRRIIERWVQDFRLRGAAGVVGGDQLSRRQGPKVDERWTETGRVPPRGVNGLHRDLVSGLVLTMP